MIAERSAKLPRHPLNPRIAGVRLSVLLAQYRGRLRRQFAAELLAGAGIAVGVALVFGALLASSSITGSAPALIRAVDGQASIAVHATSPAGISEALAQRAGRLPGVRYATFALRENAQLVGSSGRRPVQLVGLSSDVVALHGAVTRDLSAATQLLSGGIGLPSLLASELHAHAGRNVSVLAAGEAHTVRVSAVLGQASVGPVAQAPLALASLEEAQRLAGRPSRVDELLIEPHQGQGARVRRELRGLLASQAQVEDAHGELRALEATAKPLGQSTDLFAAIGAIVGLLFVLNATLLTLPERRRMVAELYTQGFELRQIRAVVVSQALILGVLSSLAGLALGLLLASTIFQQSTVYLAAAFPIAGHQTIDPAVATLALAGGVLAALIASLPPLLELGRGGGRGSSMHAAEQPVQRVGVRASRVLATLGVALLVLITALVLIDPALTILGGILLAVAVPCLIPMLFALALRALRRLALRTRGSALALATIELNATATRSIALIGVAAIAVYGSVAVQGARSDLTKGLDQAVVEFLDTAKVWVAADQNFLTTDGFHPDGALQAIARAPGVSSVRIYEGSLLNLGARRLWVRGRPAGDSRVIQASQLLQGDLLSAEARIRSGGWAAVSGGFASERHLRLGSRFALPTPAGPYVLRVAAITTNAGWAPGAITISLAEYQRHWPGSQPTALEVNLKPGVSTAAGAAAVRRALAGRRGLIVQTVGQRERSFEASAREGLRTLGQISTLLLITAALAVAAVLGASIWQRRARLASLKANGFDHLELWRALVLEASLAVTIGCADGALLGLYGHALASRWLQQSTGFPAPFSPGVVGILIALATVAGITALLVIPLGFQSARVPPSVAFLDER